MIEEILQREFYHNRISEYLVCLAIIAGGILAVRVFETVALWRLKAWAKRTSSTWDDFIVVGEHRGVIEQVGIKTTRGTWTYNKRPTCGSSRSSGSAGSSSPTRPRLCT